MESVTEHVYGELVLQPCEKHTNPYYDEYVFLKKAHKTMDYVERHVSFSETRNKLTTKYGWAIPNPSTIIKLSLMFKDHGIVEIGAGSGYWANMLANEGTDVKAFDNFSWYGPVDTWETFYHPVEQGSHEVLQKMPELNERALMLCWPNYAEPFATECLTAYTGDHLIYIGEGYGGCTGDDKFHYILDVEWEEVMVIDIPQFYGINDVCFVYKRLPENEKKSRSLVV